MRSNVSVRCWSRLDCPRTLADVDTVAIGEAMLSDKKTRDKVIHWVLLSSIGKAISRSDVPPEVVQKALRRVAQKSPATT